MSDEIKNIEDLPVSVPVVPPVATVGNTQRKVIELSRLEKAEVAAIFYQFREAESRVREADMAQQVALQNLGKAQSDAESLGAELQALMLTIYDGYGIDRDNSLSTETFTITPPRGEEFITEK